MNKLGNLVADRWVEGDGEGSTLYNAITGEVISTASTQGLDIAKMYEFARETGGHALRKMTFQERGRMIKALALHLHSKKDSFYKVSSATGATKVE
jgi:oxepin-CoA hydrolase/3-oxo-5,6-dehydrosuberyl-CoA semialdehyde dehydrogenase